MSMVWLFLLLLLNFAISCANAYYACTMWKVAGRWEKAVNYAAFAMSICGFLTVTSVVVGALAVALHAINANAFGALMGLVYLLIIGPVLVGGLVLTAESYIQAYKRRDIASMAGATWNTYAMAHNTYDAFSGISDSSSRVSKFFDSDGDKDDAASKIVVLVILVIAGAMAGGLTWAFFRLGRKHALEVTARPAYA